MATIEITIRDEFGNVLEGTETRTYTLDVGNGSFHEIEGALESIKRESFPVIEQDLLQRKQQDFIEETKKKLSTRVMEQNR